MRKFEKHFLDEIKKPVKKLDAFSVNVKRYFTNGLGVQIDKNTLPANLKMAMPFYLWQKFDMDGGFKVAQQILPPLPPWVFAYSYIQGAAFDYFNFSSLGTISSQFKPGDLICVFVDDITNINYMAWVVVNCPFQAYSSLLLGNNGGDYIGGENAGIEVYEILYGCDNTQQYNEPLHLLSTNRIGQFTDEQAQPLSFKTPETVLNDFITVKISFEINYMFGILGMMQFNSELLNFNHKIKL